MSLAIQILVTLLLLSVLIIGHELGHYTAGRLLGFDILEFSVGMGPRVFGFKKNAIEYTVRLFPIGGMCRFAEEDEAPTKTGSFRAKAPWKRAVVVFSGPFMNFVLAFLISMGLYLGYGTYDASRVTVDSVTSGGPAAVAGMQPGDEFISVDHKAIASFDSLRAALDEADSQGMPVTVKRDGETVELTLSDLYDSATESNMMGVTITYARVPDSLFAAVKHSLSFCKEMGLVVFKSLGMLFSGEAKISDMSGVVGVTRIVGEAIQYGAESVLSLGVMLSMNLGIMNLLPIPALDGGRLLFILVEWVRKKPVPPEKEGIVHLIGIILLMALTVYLVFHDVIAWIGA